MKGTLNRAFTLIELLVVIAISTIILGIVAIPMIQGFNLTRTSQAYAQAQERARAVRTQLVEDISMAASVRFAPGFDTGLNLELPAPYGVTRFENIMLDLMMPAQGDPTRGPSGAYINPGTGKEDPTLHAAKGQINLPAAPGTSMVRYWIGLRDPLADIDGDGVLDNRPYNDPYSGILMPRNADQDNLFVLYRAEVQPMVFDAGVGAFVPNLAYFADEDANGIPDFDDPDFFRITGLELDIPAKIRSISNWQEKGEIITAISRYDMLQVKFNPKTRAVFGDRRDGIVPLIRFQPRIISRESVRGTKNLRIGEETDNPMKIGPETYRTEFGMWHKFGIFISPSLYTVPSGPGAFSSGGYVRLPHNGTDPTLAYQNGFINRIGVAGFAPIPVAMFSVDVYAEAKRTGQPYAFSLALAAADAENGARGIGGARLDAANIDELIAFGLPRFEEGEIPMSFDVRDFGLDSTGQFAFYGNRVPTTGVDPGVEIGDPETPNSDPNISAPGTPWSAADTDRTINNRYNNLWARWSTFAPGFDRARYVKRYVDLAHIAQPGGIAGPLNRANGTTRAMMTPGSEKVFGPDQRPGPTYGAYVRYTRVASRPVGPNQYYINYTDLPEPNWATVFGGAASYDPKVYDPNDFISSVLQPQYRAGYLELNSRFGEPLPTGNIFVSYSFQFTETTDRMVVDYNTAESMEVVVTIKNFPQSPVPFAQSVTVKGSTQVRNFYR